MSGLQQSRTHLVERAVEALGGTGVGLEGRGVPAPSAPPAAPSHLVERAIEALGTGVAAPPGRAATPPPPTRVPVSEPPPIMAERRPVAADAVLPKPRQVALASLESAGLILPNRSRSRLSEEIAIVQHQVLRTVQAMDASARNRNIVLVTSARPGEGKSFCALNIAAGMATHGVRPVVLVDTDGKQHSMTGVLGLSDLPGLRDLANQAAQRPSTCLVPTAIGHLSIMPYGRLLGADDVQAAGARLASAIQRIAAELPDSIIVLDTPPCLSTSDPSTLAAIAGQVVMVVQAERTQRNEVEAALDMVEACPKLQLLLNRAQLTVNDTFGAYGAYGAYGANAKA